MSSVYRANDPNLRRKVAIKIIHQHLSENKEFIERFELEAAVIAQLRHSNIVQVHDFNHEGEVYFMVMEYVPGETLAKRLEALNAAGIRLPHSDTIRFLSIICDAVDYAHQQRMIHRDLKPSNVMINLVNEPILMDFGVAKIIGGRSHTATGAAMGTAAYMSPEQVRGEQTDHRSDIYSLGIMMYEMLSGVTPYHSDSTFQIMLKHINEPLPDIQLVETNTPSSLMDILERALAKNPDQRFQTAKEMAVALNMAALQLKTPTGTLTMQHPDRLAAVWQQARDLYNDREFARCLDKLEELKRADPEYRELKVNQLQQQAVEQLAERANRALVLGDFSESLTAVKSLREREVHLPELDALEAQARAGLDTLALQTRLNKLYEEALLHLDNREYQLALAKWEAIENRRGDVDFPDRLAVVKRANEGICANLYSQAVVALAQKKPEQAMAAWAQIAATDSNFPDSQNVVSAAQTMILKRERKSWRNPLMVLGSIALLLLFVFGASSLFGNNGAVASDEGDAVSTAVSSAEIAASETHTLTPTASTTARATSTSTSTSTPAHTATPTEKAVPSSTPSPTSMQTSSATLLPQNSALVSQNASLFAEPDAEAAEISVLLADEMVTIVGRSENSNWLFVEDAEGNRGFVFADLLMWEGSISDLTIYTEAALQPTITPVLSETISLDIYQLDGTEECSGSGWTQKVYMRAQGVTGSFEYYWEGELVGTAVNDNITFDVSSSGGVIIGTGSVIVNGLMASEELFIPIPSCVNE